MGQDYLDKRNRLILYGYTHNANKTFLQLYPRLSEKEYTAEQMYSLPSFWCHQHDTRILQAD